MMKELLSPSAWSRDRNRVFFFPFRKQHFPFVALFSVLVVFFSAGWGAQSAAVDTIIAEGRYVMGDRDSKEDAHQYALMEAKQKALEQAGVYVQSRSEVENFMLTEQEVSAYAAGFLRTEILEEREEPVGETRAVVVKIRALVNPDELGKEISELKKDEAASEQIAGLYSEYRRILQKLDSLKTLIGPTGQPTTPYTTPSGTVPQNQLASRNNSWAELQKFELFIQLATETHRQRPNLERIKNLTRVLVNNYPGMTIAYGYLGISYFKNGAVSEAITYLKKAIGAKPVWRYSQRRTQLPRPLQIRIQKEQAMFHYYLGLAYAKNKQPRLANRHLRQARQLDPNNPRYSRPLKKWK